MNQKGDKPTQLKTPENFIQTDRFAVFTVHMQKFAIPVSSVNRVIRGVEITPVPGSPKSMLGVINLHGETVPLVNFRRKFGFPQKEMQLEDKMIILETSSLKLAFIADAVTGLTDPVQQRISPVEKIIPGQEDEIPGMILFNDEIIMVYDIEKVFISDAGITVDLYKKSRVLKKRLNR